MVAFGTCSQSVKCLCVNIPHVAGFLYSSDPNRDSLLQFGVQDKTKNSLKSEIGVFWKSLKYWRTYQTINFLIKRHHFILGIENGERESKQALMCLYSTKNLFCNLSLKKTGKYARLYFVWYSSCDALCEVLGGAELGAGWLQRLISQGSPSQPLFVSAL